jgi:hypothetical protein
MLKVGNETEDKLFIPLNLEISALNNSSHTITDVRYHVPQLADEWTKLSELLIPGGSKEKPIRVRKPFKVHWDSRELYESATFTFSLGHVRWSTRYGHLAQRLDS